RRQSVTNDDLLERARVAKDGVKFARLWEGNWKENYTSQSEADLALCMKLAFWTDRDAGRIDTLFRRSGLMWEKWERKDYREATIAKAIEQTTETWKPRGADQRSWIVPIDADRVTPTLELLNACAVFGGRIQFTAVKRRGPMIVAEFGDGAEAIGLAMTPLAFFAREQAFLGEETQFFIQRPPRREIKADGAPAVKWILRLAGTDRISSTDSLRKESRQTIYTPGKGAGQPDPTAD